MLVVTRPRVLYVNPFPPIDVLTPLLLRFIRTPGATFMLFLKLHPISRPPFILQYDMGYLLQQDFPTRRQPAPEEALLARQRRKTLGLSRLPQWMRFVSVCPKEIRRCPQPKPSPT